MRLGLFGFRVAFGPAGLTDTVVDIPPWNPKRLWNRICELPVEPGETVRVTGLAVMLKSGTRTVTFSEWTRRPLVPVTITIKIPVGAVLLATTFRLSLTVWPAARVTDGFCIDTVNPVEEIEALSATVPWNPPRLVTAIWDWVFWPR